MLATPSLHSVQLDDKDIEMLGVAMILFRKDVEKRGIKGYYADRVDDLLYRLMKMRPSR